MDMNTNEIKAAIEECLVEYEDKLKLRVIGTRRFESWRVNHITGIWGGNRASLTKQDVQREAREVLNRLCNLSYDFFVSEPQLKDVEIVKHGDMILGFAQVPDIIELESKLLIEACPSQR